MRALIIDDEQYVRLVLEHTLREEGCDVVVASDGKAGIAALQGETFDCVITDLRMPGIDGLNVLAWVTDHQPGSRGGDADRAWRREGCGRSDEARRLGLPHQGYAI